MIRRDFLKFLGVGTLALPLLGSKKYRLVGFTPSREVRQPINQDGVFERVYAVEDISAFQVVSIDESGYARLANGNPRLLGVAQFAIPANEYGWVFVNGLTLARSRAV